jgi:hypothetical protein
MSDRSPEYDALCGDLEAHWNDQGGSRFRTAVRRLEAWAEGGSLAAAEYLAEILALDGPVHDAAAAYKWYYIALSEQGYSVGFEDQNASPPHYCGPVGDFRNEAMVNDLVAELGFARAAELDREAAEMRASRGWSET